MALPPRPPSSLIDSGLMQGGATEDLPSVDVDIPQAEDFAGGAEVIEDGMGGAIVQALEGMLEGEAEVVTEEYDHDANLAEVLPEGILGEISSDLREKYEDDLESSSQWREAYTKGLDLLGICLLYTSPSPRDGLLSRMPSSA